MMLFVLLLLVVVLAVIPLVHFSFKLIFSKLIFLFFIVDLEVFNDDILRVYLIVSLLSITRFITFLLQIKNEIKLKV